MRIGTHLLVSAIALPGAALAFSGPAAFHPAAPAAGPSPPPLRPGPCRRPRLLRMASSAVPPDQAGGSPQAVAGRPTELPDSLDDAAEIAARACSELAEAAGPMTRCRVDFDTSIGDETYTALKSSTEFMQKFVSALAYAMVPGLMERRQAEMVRVAQARAELQALLAAGTAGEGGADEGSAEAEAEAGDGSGAGGRLEELKRIVATGGRDPDDKGWDGPKIRIYFPDEGSAALARRDWLLSGGPDQAAVPDCVVFSSCGGVQLQQTSDDMIVMFFCPRASEAAYVEQVLYKTEEERGDDLALTIFVNPILVDMGVTGFGMAGRMLRERLIDPLQPAYYLRTLSWGALTRVWPRQFTVWQEDSDQEDGYRLIRSMDRLPSNPEVEDIYDIENGNMSDPSKKKGFGLLDAVADFANGMMKL